MKQGLKSTQYIIDQLKSFDDTKNYSIFPIEVKLGTKLPFIQVIRTNLETILSKPMVGEIDRCSVSVTCVNNHYKDCLDMITSVRECLDVRKITNSEYTIINIDIVDSMEDYNPQNDAYIETLVFQFDIY